MTLENKRKRALYLRDRYYKLKYSKRKPKNNLTIINDKYEYCRLNLKKKAINEVLIIATKYIEDNPSKFKNISSIFSEFLSNNEIVDKFNVFLKQYGEK